MKIALLTLGTRGDVQPFAVLGQALQQRGHQVTLATAKNFDSFVHSYNLNFIPVDADFQEILNSPEGKKMMSNPLKARKHLNRLIYPMLTNALNTFYQLAAECDCVLFHTKAMGDYFAEKCEGTFIRTNVVPAIETTREFINPVFSSIGFPAAFNKLSYKLTDLGLKMMSKPINAFREKIGLQHKYKKPVLPSIYGISKHFLRQPADYPVQSNFTGFWFESSSEELDPAISSFAKAGDPPLLFTLGSMPFETRLNLPSALSRVTADLGVRIIVVKGWGLNDTSELEQNENIKVIKSAPYDKLVPLVKAVINHGGIGTIAYCLRHGKPFMTCPVLYPLGDQHFWGMLGYKNWIAVKPIPLKKLTEKNLLHAVNLLQTKQSLYKHATTMMEKVRTEDGICTAINLIEQYCSKRLAHTA